jgi:hypothetical protein
MIAITPDEATCTGETDLDPQMDQSFAIAEADPQAGTPGYEEGDAITFWARASNGDIYVLTPTFASCSAGDPLCVDEAVYQRNGIYTIQEMSVTILPVELVGWRARVSGRQVVLTWETASETNNAGFGVLHREAGKPGWDRLGFVEGQGTTQVPTSYSFTTHALSPGQHQFRLRQVDTDGTSTLTAPVTSLVSATLARISPARPHPVQETSTMMVTVSETQPVDVQLYDMLGRRVAVLHEGPITPSQPATITLDSSLLGAGIYVVIATGKSFRSTQRVTVTR